jgi:hypothetical protein
MVNGKQLTIAWYVDNNKISHFDPKVVDWLIAEIEKKHDKMTVCHGKKHTFLGMNIEFLEGGKLKILMKDYISEAIKDVSEEVKCKATSPAAKGLFEVDSKNKCFSRKKSDVFHSIFAKLLYFCIWSRFDTSLAVAFLTTRVSKKYQTRLVKIETIIALFK